MTMRSEELFKRVRTSRTFRNLIDAFRLDQKSVLDIGCSEGHYLQCFGPGSVGVTIIEEHVAAARARGLQVERKNAEDPAFSMEKRFDVVWANNLFEHLNAPHPFLARLRDVATEDGLLVLGVPVIPRLSFLVRFRKFRGAFAVSHVNFFTRRTLMETVRAAGWDVVDARLFYFRNRLLDSCMNWIAPHIYVIATPRKDFSYHGKRLQSLAGY